MKKFHWMNLGVIALMVGLVGLIIVTFINNVNKSHRGDVITPNAVYLDCEVDLSRRGYVTVTTVDGQTITIQGNATVRWR